MSTHNTFVKSGGASNTIYALGFIGAIIYYWQHAGNFWMVLLGVLKALVWPAFLVLPRSVPAQAVARANTSGSSRLNCAASTYANPVMPTASAAVQ